MDSEKIDEHETVDLEFRDKLKKRLGQVAAVGLGVVGVSALAEGGLLGVGNPIARTTQTVPAVPAATTTQAVNATWTIQCWGDSLTNGAQGNYATNATPYPTQLATLTGRPVINQGQSGATSATALSNVQSNTQAYGNCAVIWIGYNDIVNSISYTTVISNINSIIADLATVGNTDYIVVGTINSDIANQLSGQTMYTNLQQLDTNLKSTYGSKFVEVWTPLLNAYNSGNAFDVYDVAHGVVPTSLRYVHATGTLGGAIGTSDTSFSINFTSNPYNYFDNYGTNAIILVDSEKIVIGGVSSNTVTSCTRGALGTSQASHSSGAAVTIIDPTHLNTAGYAVVAAAVAAGLAAAEPAFPSNTAMTPTNISALLASPPPIGTTAPSQGQFTSLVVTGVGITTTQESDGGLLQGVNAFYSPPNVLGSLYIGNQTGGANANTCQDSGGYNVGVGYQTMNGITTGSHNTAIGNQALTAITTGAFNTALGVGCLNANSTGSGNVSVGQSPLGSNVSGSYNVGIGYIVMGSVTATSNCIGIGYDVLSNTNYTGTRNYAIGTHMFGALTSGQDNLGFGTWCWTALTSGSGNIAIGYQVAFNSGTTVSNCTLIGYGATVGTDGISNATGIGAGASITASNQIVLGNNSVTSVTTAGSISPGNKGTRSTASNIWSGTGTPQGNLSGTAGDYYFRVDGSTNTHLYICTGTTNWTAVI